MSFLDCPFLHHQTTPCQWFETQAYSVGTDWLQLPVAEGNLTVEIGVDFVRRQLLEARSLKMDDDQTAAVPQEDRKD